MYEPQRLLARLNPVAVNWQDSARTTGEVLRAEDIAASMAGLERGPYLLALYLWSGDDSVMLELYGLLFVEVKCLASSNNWRCKNDNKILMALIKMAMHEVKKVSICSKCKGTGVKLLEVCGSCKGSGRKRRMQSEYASTIGVKVSNWKKCWAHKYHEVFMIITDWEAIAIAHIVSKL